MNVSVANGYDRQCDNAVSIFVVLLIFL